MTRILLVPSFNIVDGRLEPYVPYGVLALQAATLGKGEVSIFYPSDELLNTKYDTTSQLVSDLTEAIDLDSFGSIGFSTVCNSAHLSLGVAKKIKLRRPSVNLFLGGPYVTKIYEEVLDAFPFIDFVFVGEGEISFSEFVLCNDPALKFHSIPGIADRRTQFVPAREVVTMDSLPFIGASPDYYPSLDLVRRLVPSGAATPLEATRGCPLRCSFCSTKQVWGAAVRRKSPAMLIDEMNRISNHTGQTFFSLVGDNVGVPRAPFIRFCEEFKELNSDLGFTWGCSLKLDRLTKDHLQLMYESGCRAIFVGLESSSQSTLNLVDKTSDIETEIARVHDAVDVGLHVETSFIIGFPWETEDELWDTYNLHCELLNQGVFRSQVSLLSPIPGTEIVKDAKLSFDGLVSYMTDDGLRLSEQDRLWLKEYPSLFSHFGHYETPHASRTVLKALRDASSQMAGIHAQKRTERDLSSSGNHGRAMGATYPFARELS